MPIFGLIHALGAKNGTYASFLGAWGEIRQMKNTRSSLATMAQCLVSEHSEGKSKCLDYYVSNGVDRAVLHLNTQEDLESFYIAVLPLFSEKYLRSEFWRAVWRYGKLSRVCKYYCERCVVYGIFNEELANYLVEASASDQAVREGLAIVCVMESYSRWLDDMGFAFIVINRINSLVEVMSDDSIDLLNFACYYEDRTCADILSHVSIRLRSTAAAVESSSRAGMAVHTDSRDAPSSGELVPLKAQMEFLLRMFRDVKSGRVRSKVLKESCSISRNRGRGAGGLLADLIIECVKLDPDTVASSLCKPMANTWSPALVLRHLLECTSLKSAFPCDSGCAFKETLMGMCGGDVALADACMRMPGAPRSRRRDASLMDTIIFLRVGDPRVLALLYCADRVAFFNHFADILGLMGKKTLDMVVADMVWSGK